MLREPTSFLTSKVSLWATHTLTHTVARPPWLVSPQHTAFSQKARLELHALTLTDTYWGHQLVAKPTWDSYQAKCVNAEKKNVRDCLSLEMTILNGVGNLNPYALDYPVCTADSATKAGYSQRLWLLNSRFSSVMSREEIRQKVRTWKIEKLFLFIDKYMNIYVFLGILSYALAFVTIHSLNLILSWTERGKWLTATVSITNTSTTTTITAAYYN